MRRNHVIEHMLVMHAKLAQLPPPPHRGYYTAKELIGVIGHSPRHHDATVMRLLGWVRCARTVNGKTARAWLPPQNAGMTRRPT